MLVLRACWFERPSPDSTKTASHRSSWSPTARVRRPHSTNCSTTTALQQPPNSEAPRRPPHLHQHQHVEGVGVLAQRLGDEPVVVGVDHARVQDAVDVAEAGVLVQLVLDLGAARDLDHGVDDLGRVGAGGEVVPGVGRGAAVEAHGCCGWGPLPMLLLLMLLLLPPVAREAQGVERARLGDFSVLNACYSFTCRIERGLRGFSGAAGCNNGCSPRRHGREAAAVGPVRP